MAHFGEPKESGGNGEMMSHEQFMRRAIELSRGGMAIGSGGPFGAVVVKDGKIIGEGYNMVLETNDPTAHAEVTAIRNAAAALRNFSLEGCDMYCIGLSCPMCMASIFWARIDHLYYVLPPEEAEDIGFDDKYFFRRVGKAGRPARLSRHSNAGVLQRRAGGLSKLENKGRQDALLNEGFPPSLGQIR